MFLLDLFLTEPIGLLLLSAALALIPLTLWIYIFWKQHPVDRKLAIYTTIGGMLIVLPIWAYQWAFERYEHLDIFAAIRALDMDHKLIYLITFMAVGVIEEQFKHWVVQGVASHKKEWRGIADAISFSVLAAIGFAFIENIVYFVGIMKFEGYAALIIPFAFRSAFSTFAHIFFSGVYGYHFGIAKHAKEWMIESLGPKHHQKFLITRFFYQLFKIKPINFLTQLLAGFSWVWLAYTILTKLQLPIIQNSTETFEIKLLISGVFIILIGYLGWITFKFITHLHKIRLDQVLAEEEVAEGLFLAMGLHAIFNFILWLEWTWLIPIFLFSGYLYLAHELKLKRNLLDFEKVEEELQTAKQVKK